MDYILSTDMTAGCFSDGYIAIKIPKPTKETAAVKGCGSRIFLNTTDGKLKEAYTKSKFKR